MANILLVDDDNMQRELISDLLEVQFHKISHAATGEEALKILDDRAPDLILLDVMMPGIDGIETCRRIRERKELSAVPILMLTALDADEHALKALAVGADDFITKSASPKIILARVGAHLRSKALYDRVDRIKRDQSAIMDIMIEITSDLDVKRVLQVLAEKASKQVDGRVTVIVVDEKKKRGRIIACSDIGDEEEIEIDLDKYPEIMHAFDSKKDVIIRDVHNDQRLKGMAKTFAELNITSMAVIPLVFYDEVMGTLFLRARGKKEVFDDEDIRLAKIIAAAASNAIKNASFIARLRDKKAELESANESLQQLHDLRAEFFAMTAHDLRAPLSVICSGTEALLDDALGELNEAQRTMLTMSLDSCEQLIAFARDLQEISHLESGKLDLKLQPEDMGGILRSAVEKMAPLARKEGIALSLSGESDDATLLIDAGKVVRVLENLITNALLHNDKGCSVTLRGKRSDGEYTVFVEDDGKGIGEDEIPNIFDDYFTSGKKKEGRGLGLYICKKFVAAHGGSIGLEKREGGGSRFFFCLPAGTDQAEG